MKYAHVFHDENTNDLRAPTLLSIKY
jgi:hypothetical protein